jgi:hypothetical protein
MSISWDGSEPSEITKTIAHLVKLEKQHPENHPDVLACIEKFGDPLLCAGEVHRCSSSIRTPDADDGFV